MGAICGQASDKALINIRHYAESLGLAFQLVDDLLDVTGNAAQLGKATGKDASAGKRTHAGQLGLQAARAMALELTQKAAAAIEPLGDNAIKLRRLAELLAARSR